MVMRGLRSEAPSTASDSDGVLAGLRQHGVVAGGTDCLDDCFWLSLRGVEDHRGLVGHEIDARRFNAGCRLEGRLDVMLACGTGHSHDREGESLCMVGRHQAAYSSKCAV